MFKKLTDIIYDRLNRKNAKNINERQFIYKEIEKHILASAKRHGLTQTHPNVQRILDEFNRAVASVESAFESRAAVPKERSVVSQSVQSASSTTAHPLKRRVIRGRLLALIFLLAMAPTAMLLLTDVRMPISDKRSEVVSITSSPDSVLVARSSDIQRFRAPKGNTLELKGDFIRISSAVNDAKSIGNTEGAFLIIPKDVEQRVGGKTIAVTIWARASANKPSPSFAIAYSTAAVGNSGWQSFKPGLDVEAYRFEYNVPVPKGAPGLDFIGIWADTAGKGRAIEIMGLEILVKN